MAVGTVIWLIVLTSAVCFGAGVWLGTKLKLAATLAATAAFERENEKGRLQLEAMRRELELLERLNRKGE